MTTHNKRRILSHIFAFNEETSGLVNMYLRLSIANKVFKQGTLDSYFAINHITTRWHDIHSLGTKHLLVKHFG